MFLRGGKRTGGAPVPRTTPRITVGAAMRCVPFLLLALLLSDETARADDAKLDVRETPVGTVSEVVVETITPSPDGRRLAYAARAGEKLVLTVDGKPAGKPYEGFAV